MSEPLYHGTDEQSENNILNNGINININPNCGDCGRGFYLSPVLDSAKQWALRKAFLNNKPAVIELTLVKNYQDIIKVKDFGLISKQSSDVEILEWAQFIVNNRCGLEYVKKVAAPNGYENNNLDKRYDLVIGTIADGAITKIAKQCNAEQRLITIKEANNLLNKEFGLQYCLCTENALEIIDKKPRKKKGVSWR